MGPCGNLDSRRGFEPRGKGSNPFRPVSFHLVGEWNSVFSSSFCFFCLRQQMRCSLQGNQSKGEKSPCFAKGKALHSFLFPLASFARLPLIPISRQNSPLPQAAPTPSSAAMRPGQFQSRFLRAKIQAHTPATKIFSLWQGWQLFSLPLFCLLQKSSSSLAQFSQSHQAAGA